MTSHRSTNMARTLAEQLDDAESGEEFGQVIMGLFSFLDTARDDG